MRSPGADKESNWLPCPPSGPFDLTIRLYQPKPEMLDGKTKNNVVVKTGSNTIRGSDSSWTKTNDLPGHDANLLAGR